MKRLFKNEKIMKTLIVVFLIIFSLLISFKSINNPFSATAGTDSDVFEYIGEEMKAGGVPYRDTFDHKGPLLYFINFLGACISEKDGIWVFEVVTILISIFLVYKISRRFLGRFYAVIVTFISGMLFSYLLSTGNMTEEFAMPFELLALDILFDFFITPKKYIESKNIKSFIPFVRENSKFFSERLKYKWFDFRVMICGACLGAVLMLRPNMIAIWAVFGLFVALICIKNKCYQDFLRIMISLVAGVMIIVIPFLIYLGANGAIGDFIEDYIVFNFAYTNGETITLEKRKKAAEYFMDIKLIAVCFIIMIIKIWFDRKKRDNIFNIWYFVFMLVSLMLISLSGRTYEHYAMTLVPMTIFPLSALFYMMETKKDKNARFLSVIVLCIMMLVIMKNPMQDMYDKSLRNMVSRREDKKYSEIVDYIKANTEETEKISVFGNADGVYLRANRKSVSKYSYQSPVAELSDKIREEYFRDLEEKKPKLIVIPNGKSGSEKLNEVMNEFLNSHLEYEKVEVNDGKDLIFDRKNNK